MWKNILSCSQARQECKRLHYVYTISQVELITQIGIQADISRELRVILAITWYLPKPINIHFKHLPL